MSRTLVHIVTVPVSLRTFFDGQIRYMKSRGFDVQAIASPGPLLEEFGETEEIDVHGVKMPRKISPLRDLVAIFFMCRVLWKIRPEIVHAHTPKAGLLGMIAAWLTRVPVRVYHIRGLPLVTARGPRRWLLRFAEQIACGLAHQVLCVSHSVSAVAVEEKLCRPQKLSVLRGGSGNGVDSSCRFNPSKIDPTKKNKIRLGLGIHQDDQTLGFVGRIVRDKGIVELVESWKTLRKEFPTLHLLMIGSFEPRDSVSADIKKFLLDDPRIHLVGQCPEIPKYYSTIDICVLPTYREGLPNVLLEAAAMECPVVATRVPGCVDVVVEGETGMLVPERDAESLTNALRIYLTDRQLQCQHGKAARRLVQENFLPEDLWAALYAEYLSIADLRGVSLPRVQPLPVKREAAA